MLRFRNVDASPSDDVTTWPFEALATAIDRGLVADWQPVFAEIRRAPWGTVARRVERHLGYRDPDGTSAIFRLAIQRARHHAEQAERGDVATRVRRSIERSGLTNAEFARNIGTSASRLSTYATGKVVPSAAMLVRIEHVARDSGVGDRGPQPPA